MFSFKNLRSGRCYHINLSNPPERVGKIKEGIWRQILIKKHPHSGAQQAKSNLKLMNIEHQFLHSAIIQKWNGEAWMSDSHLNTLRLGRGIEWLNYKKMKKKSRFSSCDKGTMVIPIEEDEENYHKSVRFKEIKIIFY